MEKQLARVLGQAATHILDGLLHALRAVALTFIIVALVVAVATEVVGAFLTHAFPTGPTHLAAAALAVAFGYAAAMTVAVEQILRATIRAVEFVVHEAEKLEQEAQHALGQLSQRGEEELMRLGKSALTDVGAFGHVAAGDAAAFGRGAARAVGGVVSDVEHDARAIEHGVGEHLPGHHESAVTQQTTVPSVTPQR